MPEIDHWEALFDQNYLRWFDLAENGNTAEIEKVEPRVELTLPGGKKAKKPVIHFKKGSKPLVLNSTNGRSIADLHGEKPSDWIGKKVVLYPTQTDMYDQHLKKMVKKNCIRIRGVGK